MLPDLHKTIASAHDGLVRGDFSSAELTGAYLDQIRGLNGALNAYLSVFDEQALQDAFASDERRKRGQARGVLDGVPIALKDNLLVAGTRCTAGSKILDRYIAVDDATAVKKLKHAGAVILGKTNMDEFAMGSSTEHSAYGPTRHPSDPERVPGGSSGGSACAVAADLCVAALGSDTGGSIRQPASFCGIVGLKPTYGRVSRSGLIAMASSLDQIGPLTKTVDDAEMLLSVIAGEDVLDQTTVSAPEMRMKRPHRLDGLRIGLPKEAWGEGMHQNVRAQAEQAVARFTVLGAECRELSLPYADEALAAYYVIMPCEVSANLSRFDGMRYGLRASGTNLVDVYADSRGEYLGAEPRRRILLGTYALSKGYYDAYYRQARKVRTLIRRAYDQVFRQVDVLLTPTAPSTAWKLGEKTADPLTMYLEDVFTVGVNVAGVPALSVPCGDRVGLPVGVQLIGRMFDEATLLDTAYAFSIHPE